MSRGGPDLEIGRRAGVPPAPFFVHLFRALFLSRDFYERVAADHSATRQAVAVVCLAALAYGGTLMPVSPAIEQLAHWIGYWLLVLLMVLGLARWLLFTAILWAIGAFVLQRRAAFVPLLRCVGFAQVPALLSLVVLLDPGAAFALYVLILVWLLAASIVAVRAAFSIGLGRALAIGVLGNAADFLLPQLAAGMLLAALFND